MDEEFDEQFQDLIERHVRYLKESREKLRSLWQKVEESEDRQALHEVVAIVHRISGSSATFGFESLSATAGKLEDAILEVEDEGVHPSPSDYAAWGRLLEKLLNDIPSE